MGKAIYVPNITFSTNLGSVKPCGWVYMGIELPSADSTMRGSQQGAAVYGDYIFGGEADSGKILIRQLSTAGNIATITISNAAVTGRHMNSLCFGHLKYDVADEFPIMYGGGNIDTLINTIDTYRVTRNGNTFSIALVGSYDTSIFGYVDVAYWDGENNKELILQGRNRTYRVTPPPANTTSYTFTKDDVIAEYWIGSYRQYIQQPCVFQDRLFFPYFDTYTQKGTYDFMMKVLDLRTGEILWESKEFNYNQNYSIEFEAAVVWNNQLYLVNTTYGYKVDLVIG